MIRRCPRRTLMAVVLLLAAVVAAACSGCGGDSDPAAWEEPAADAGVHHEDRDRDSAEGADTVGNGEGVVHMCGRSVLGGWFEHWGWEYDPDDPVRFGSYHLVYHEMEGPPGIVETAIDAAREAADAGSGSVFFKFCFEDFAGGDENEARENLEDNKHMIVDIVEAVVEEEGLTLIVGNALPMVREYTEEWLVWNHREYNLFLDGLADSYGGRVIVLDMYGALSTPDGWLRPEYAADEYDSHLSEAAYDVLDLELADILR